jgi:biopolymer transport protein ExbD
MIATPLINQEQKIEVDLPVETQRPQTTPKETRFVAITVKADGLYRIDADGNRPLGPRDLPGRLQALVAASPGDPPAINIRGDAGVDFQKIVTLMDELKKAGLNQVNFDTQVRN